MRLTLKFTCLLSLFVLLPSLYSSLDTFTSSRATYYGSPDGLGTPSGACGFGEYGRKINSGNVGAVAKLYRNGIGCGACYQVRCTQPQLCTKDGVKILVTDHGQGDNTDFILSSHGFKELARPTMTTELMALGVVDIEYRRVSCKYPGHNLTLKVDENSKFPDYLAIIILYQGGQKDITAIQLWQDNVKEWRAMRRAYGGVWDMANPPEGALNLRFLASGKWVQLKNVIPSDWKAGMAYDSHFQLL
ncbi:expansin-like B1 [Magnolia sinica]|uniref:expansin-like B1 n=1 Tax=Magnolia sinica TaxID=86752 RepID=UPI0026595910|nr:expansin-like B1 [Magnolia sinica]